MKEINLNMSRRYHTNEETVNEAIDDIWNVILKLAAVEKKGIREPSQKKLTSVINQLKLDIDNLNEIKENEVWD